jgi:hypothetical protein
MKMLDGSKDFRVQILWIVPQLSQRGVDPRKHPRSRPMRLNIRRPFSHSLVSRRLYKGTTVMSELQSAEIDPQHGAVPNFTITEMAWASDRQSLEQSLEEDPNVDCEIVNTDATMSRMLHCRDVHRASVSRLPDLHLLKAVSRPMSKLDRITIYRTEPTSLTLDGSKALGLSVP